MKPHSTNKPWGSFRQFTHNEKTTVKLLFVTAGQELSLQTHEKRKEFWYIIKGTPKLVLGEKIIHARTGDEFTIPKKKKHRIIATDTDVVLLEIAYGDFNEDDIIRYGDIYGRT